MNTEPQQHYERPEHQQEIVDWIGDRKWDLFITLTFYNKVTDNVANKTLKTFLTHLSRKCYGRQKKRVECFAVLEHTANASHFHLTMNQPKHWCDVDFKKAVRKCWMKLKGTGVNNLLLKNNGKDKSWFEYINDTKEDVAQVIGYMTKHVNKNCDTLAINNIHLN